MSPTKYQDTEVITKGGMINGQRLCINKESHLIQKSSSSSPSSSPLNEPSGQSKQSKRQPVIIYTHTPKVIHVQARDFMAVVQRLTGMSSSDSAEKPAKSEAEAVKEEEILFSGDQKDCGHVKNNNIGYNNIGENEASSALMNIENNSSNYFQFLTTNSSNDLFCSSRFSSNFFHSPSSFLDYNM